MRRFVWDLPRDLIQQRQDSLGRERCLSAKFSDTPASLFKKQLKKEFPLGYGPYSFFERKAVFQCTSSFYSVPEDEGNNLLVLIRSLYVVRKERGNGNAVQLLRRLTKLADEVGVCLISICSPFERWGDPDENETVDEVARDFDTSEFAFSTIHAKDEYEPLQKRMGVRFRLAGFNQVDVGEVILDKTKFTPEHCWMYVPDICDGSFREAMNHRMLNPTMNEQVKRVGIGSAGTGRSLVAN